MQEETSGFVIIVIALLIFQVKKHKPTIERKYLIYYVFTINIMRIMFLNNKLGLCLFHPFCFSFLFLLLILTENMRFFSTSYIFPSDRQKNIPAF